MSRVWTPAEHQKLNQTEVEEVMLYRRHVTRFVTKCDAIMNKWKAELSMKERARVELILLPFAIRRRCAHIVFGPRITTITEKKRENCA